MGFNVTSLAGADDIARTPCSATCGSLNVNPPSVLPLARRGEQIENVVWFDNAYQVAPYNSSSEKFLLPISRPLRGNELIRQARTQVMDRTARTHGLP